MKYLNELNLNELNPASQKAAQKGYIFKTSAQAQMINSFDYLFSGKVTLEGNGKTQSIPCFNLPNIYVQAQFLQLVKWNKEKIFNRVPEQEMENFVKFLNYLKTFKMCVNCSSCRKLCYNNQIYNFRDTKAIADLRQLYLIVNDRQYIINKLIALTNNAKYVRLNGSGEIHNEYILSFYKELAKKQSDTIFYTYTKNYDLIAGKKLPKNLIINLSDFNNNFNRDLFPKNFNIYKAIPKSEYEKIEETKIIKKCYGQNCSTCKLCTKKKGLIIYEAIK